MKQPRKMYGNYGRPNPGERSFAYVMVALAGILTILGGASIVDHLQHPTP